MIEELLAAGADPNEQYLGEPLLYSQAEVGDIAVIQALIEAGANPMVRGPGGATPLHRAADWGDFAVVQLLVDTGADPSARTDYGGTPLHAAAASILRDGNRIQLLIDAGADPGARTDSGTTPLHLVRLAANAEALLAAGAVLRRDENGRTPLHTAAMDFGLESSEFGNLIGVFVGAGADIGARDAFGQTPLHRAAAIDRRSLGSEFKVVMEVLIANGADINAKDRDGNTPLHLAAKCECESTPITVSTLLDAGADAAKPNAQEQTPWDLARSNENFKGSDAYWRLNEARFAASTDEG